MLFVECAVAVEEEENGQRGQCLTTDEKTEIENKVFLTEAGGTPRGSTVLSGEDSAKRSRPYSIKGSICQLCVWPKTRHSPMTADAPHPSTTPVRPFVRLSHMQRGTIHHEISGQR